MSAVWYIAGKTEAILLGRTEAILLGRTESIILGKTEAILLGRTESILLGRTEAILLGRTESILLGKTEAILLGRTEAILLERTEAILLERTEAILLGRTESILLGRTEAILLGRTEARLLGCYSLIAFCKFCIFWTYFYYSFYLAGYMELRFNVYIHACNIDLHFILNSVTDTTKLSSLFYSWFIQIAGVEILEWTYNFHKFSFYCKYIQYTSINTIYSTETTLLELSYISSLATKYLVHTELPIS